MSDEMNQLIKALLDNCGKVFGVVLGLVAGFVSVHYGLAKALIFSLFVIVGYQAGRYVDNRETAISFIERVLFRSRR